MSGETWFWAATDDEERWNGPCDSREEAIAEGANELDLGPDDGFYVNTGTKVNEAEMMPSAEWIIESAGERAQDECGEVAEDWPDVTEAAKKELETLLANWVRKHAPTTFYTIDGKPEAVTAGDQTK